MNLLFISRWFPYPANNGSKIRIFNLLRGLAEQHRITLLTFFDPGEEIEVDAPPLRELCAQIFPVPWRGFNPGRFKARLAFFNPRPRSVIDTFSPEMADRVLELSGSGEIDLVIASQINTAAYARFFNGVPAIFEEVELAIYAEQVRDAQTVMQQARAQLMWAKRKNFVRSILRHFAACTVVSAPEKELLARVAPEFPRIELIPNCMHVAEYDQVVDDAGVQKEAATVIFSGSFTYYVNHEAMVWYLQAVNGLVQAAVPGVRLMITGDHADLPLPAADNVTLTGFVDDIRSVIAAATVSIAPIFHGGGTRLKILEAMALRVPVVATSKGAEGIDLVPGRDCLLADSPGEFATAVIRLLRDPDLRRRVADNGYRLVREKYDWSTVTPRLHELIEAVVDREHGVLNYG